jgi:tetratricopeptide (TPR) repeat protein
MKSLFIALGILMFSTTIQANRFVTDKPIDVEPKITYNPALIGTYTGIKNFQKQDYSIEGKDATLKIEKIDDYTFSLFFNYYQEVNVDIGLYNKAYTSHSYYCYMSNVNGVQVINAIQRSKVTGKDEMCYFFLYEPTASGISIVAVKHFLEIGKYPTLKSSEEVRKHFSEHLSTNTFSQLMSEKETFGYNGAASDLRFNNFKKKIETAAVPQNKPNQQKVELLYQKGETLFLEKKYMEAISVLDSAIRIEPKMAKAFQRQGACKLNLANQTKDEKLVNDAISTLETAYKLDSNSWKTCQNLTQAYVDIFRIKANKEYIEKAIAYGNRALATFDGAKKDCRIHIALADAYFLNKTYREALLHFETTISNCPDDKYYLHRNAYLGIAKSNYWLDQNDASIKALDWFKGKEHEFTSLEYYYGMNYFYLKKYTEALEQLKEYIRKEGEYAEANYFIGKIYYLLNDYTQAKIYLGKAISQGSANKEAAVELLETMKK